MNIITQIATLIISAPLLLIMLLATSLIWAIPVWLLWNGCLVGAVAFASQVTFFQAWGLVVLCAILFKSSASSSH